MFEICRAYREPLFEELLSFLSRYQAANLNSADRATVHAEQLAPEKQKEHCSLGAALVFPSVVHRTPKLSPKRAFTSPARNESQLYQDTTWVLHLPVTDSA